MMRRKLFSVARNELATQRCTILPSFQRLTRFVRILTPACGLSITLVVARQRCRDVGTSSRLMVKHYSSPSSRLAAAAGHSRSSHSESFRILAIPSLCPNFQAAFISALT
jgi:hypothetical protein